MHINYEERDAIAYVELNRPEKRNALTRAMLERLAEIFVEIEGRRDLRALIFSGAGKDFCAGSDIAELEGLDEDGALSRAELGQRACDLIETCGVPVIVALRGAAVGGGCELALACHLRVVTRDAYFALPEVRLGLIPAYGATQRLARQVGCARAFASLIGGEPITSGAASTIGLVNLVVEDPAELMTRAEEYARRIAATAAPLAVRACLEAVTRGMRMPFDEGLKLEAQLFSRLLTTADAGEGTRAFLEKRQPVFKGE